MILVDAGPLVALVDADDQHHSKCVSALKRLREPLATVWPPFTEAMYLLADLPAAQEALWEMLERGAMYLLPLDSGDVPRMRNYSNRPMDLADAALLRVAEREGIRKIFTVDRRDFAGYRLHGHTRLTLIALTTGSPLRCPPLQRPFIRDPISSAGRAAESEGTFQNWFDISLNFP